MQEGRPLQQARLAAAGDSFRAPLNLELTPRNGFGDAAFAHLLLCCEGRQLLARGGRHDLRWSHGEESGHRGTLAQEANESRAFREPDQQPVERTHSKQHLSVYGRARGLPCTQRRDVVKPAPAEDGVLNRVLASSINSRDDRRMKANPCFIRFMAGGLFRPRTRIVRAAAAGPVESIGASRVIDYRKTTLSSREEPSGSSSRRHHGRKR